MGGRSLRQKKNSFGVVTCVRLPCTVNEWGLDEFERSCPSRERESENEGQSARCFSPSLYTCVLILRNEHATGSGGSVLCTKPDTAQHQTMLFGGIKTSKPLLGVNVQSRWLHGMCACTTQQLRLGRASEPAAASVFIFA